MRARAVLTTLLGFFLVAAVIVVARQGTEKAPAPAAAAEPTAEPRAEPAAASPLSAPPDPMPAPAEAVPAPASAAPRERSALPATPKHRVIAMYFHGNVRCATCRKVESYAREAVETGFGDEVSAGLVEFRAVNVEEPANRHFVEDYQLTSKAVVVIDEEDGNVARWVKLDEVWALVGNHEAYLLYVQDAVRSYVED